MDDTEVFVAKGSSPSSTFYNGMELIGGLNKIVHKNDKVFIKISLNGIEGFPSHSNFEILKLIVKECKESGAKEVFIGCYPRGGIKTGVLDSIFNLNDLLNPLGAQFINFNESLSFEKIVLQEIQETIRIPKILLDCDKQIIFNQISVNPMFDISLSIYSAYSLVPLEYLELKPDSDVKEHQVSNDLFKKELISKIIDIHNIRKPDLVINDLFHVMEAAGPFIYRDSNLVKTNLMILGKNAISVDLATLQFLGIKPTENNLINAAIKQNKITHGLENLVYTGEPIEALEKQIKLCEKNLDQLNLYGTDIKLGKFCSGCYEKAYHLLNFMKTYMIKDLHYIGNQSILIGIKPEEPEKSENVILFGDCAIKSTRDYEFRNVKIKKEVFPLKNLIKKAFRKDKVEDTKIKTKIIENHQILNLNGCPPDGNQILMHIFDYYGENELPNLNFLLKCSKSVNEVRRK